ncbi:SLAP domain-containing protein [Sporosarcina sp. PTS2304]|uniref:SLAP domain-containing protein n=1 Tax=Sporosarcina sp. PTS2304 TaxID=2283194 RepID=UPI000E0D205B|nr:SLAP domain-containing protein [Sporosarcina sp. PTS2304]AXH99957.1 SLAP domain-containing protein [Sporosarcina sp. PTS2304]
MQLVFEKTWDATLSEQQKLAFIQQYATKEPIIDEFTASPILIKRKRHGGIVATVFLQNNRSTHLAIRDTNVYVVNELGEVIAQETFSLSLDIPPYAATPWSFVFLPGQVLVNSEPTDEWKVEVK